MHHIYEHAYYVARRSASGPRTSAVVATRQVFDENGRPHIVSLFVVGESGGKEPLTPQKHNNVLTVVAGTPPGGGG